MLNNENFITVLEKEPFAVILIAGEGCANCVTMYPMVKSLETRRDDVKVFYVEIDENNYQINDHYEVEVVPTILLTNHGKLISKIKGYQPEEIFEIYVDTKIEECKKQSQN